ncbi:MAG: hypothetical protein J7K40_07845 [candidate division Zixibacteria bacterium]|nr:hypothetical protein [candidate division Zixibacteria bacterium]
MGKWFVIWDDELKRFGAASAFSRSWIKDLFSSPFWDNIPDKPSVFPPEAHASSHAKGGADELSLDASQITSGTLSVDRIPSLPRSKISDFWSTPFWDNIPDKPSTFPPESHTHSVSDVTFNNSVIPTQDNAFDIGSHSDRFKNGWFAGSLGLGVIADVGTQLYVDIIYDDAYSQAYSNTSGTRYQDTGTYQDFSTTINYYTANGIITGVKVSIEFYNPNPFDMEDVGEYRIYEDGALVGSVQVGTVPANSTVTRIIEFNTKKTSATITGEWVQNVAGYFWVTRRDIFLRKRFIGIKAGQI